MRMTKPPHALATRASVARAAATAHRARPAVTRVRSRAARAHCVRPTRTPQQSQQRTLALAQHVRKTPALFVVDAAHSLVVLANLHFTDPLVVLAPRVPQTPALHAPVIVCCQPTAPATSGLRDPTATRAWRASPEPTKPQSAASYVPTVQPARTP